jgi:hypothetical protein
MLRQLYHKGKSSQYSVERRLVLDTVENGKIACFCREIESSFPGRATYSVVDVLTELPWFSIAGRKERGNRKKRNENK